MSLIEKAPDLTRRELADQLSCSDSTVKRELKILSDIGLIKREGAKKNGRWIITKTE
jgi:predicted transcriptional regulator